jgi:hypothetical protein
MRRDAREMREMRGGFPHLLVQLPGDGVRLESAS